MKSVIIIVLCFSMLYACSDKSAENKVVSNKSVPVRYALSVVEKAGVANTVKLPAQLAAYEEVSIFPKVNGYVKTVLVDIGSKVTKGQLLMVLEAPELQQASMQARERYERNKANFALDKEQYQRFLEVSETAGAISPMDLSSIKSKMQADSSLSNAEKLNWQMQETMMGYLKVTAPFTGVITERNVHPGALVSSAAKDKPMLELKQINHLRLQADIPEAVAASLEDKDTLSFYLNAMPGKKMTGTISRQAMNLNTQYRSERMEIDVDNSNEKLSPGMYADVILYSKGNSSALSVPKSAVVISTERKFVLVVNNGKIKKVDVSTGNESTSKIEIYGMLQPGDSVITKASDEISATN